MYWAIFGLDDGLAPARFKTIKQTDVDLGITRSCKTKFNEYSIENQFSI